MYPFREGCFAPKNGWYVAAFANEVGREPLSRWILNEPVAMFRTTEGEAVAVGGRCPHRHFPLGKGRVEGNSLVCGYHGIAFGADGACTNIPSQSHLPKSYRIPTYPLVQHGIWLFIWPGDPELADPALLPDLNHADYYEDWFRIEPFFAIDVPGRYQLLNDNLLDLTHLAYLHGTSIGVPGNASVAEVREEYPNMLRSRRVMPSVPIMKSMEGSFDYDGPVDRISGMDFHLPGFHAGLDEMRIPESDADRPGEILTRRRVFHAVTPGKLNTTNYFFALGGEVTADDMDRSRDYLRAVIEEDVMATREIEDMLATLGFAPPELMLKSDASAVRGRRALQAMMDQEAASAAPGASARHQRQGFAIS